MNNNILNTLQLYKSKYFGDLIEENKLANALLIEPEKISTVLSYAFGMYEPGYNTLDMLTGGLGQTLTVSNREYTWDMMIDHDRAITIRKAEWQGSSVDTSSSSTDVPGINGTTVQIWLEEKYFGPGAILAFDDREFTARVMGAPYQDGDLFVYTVQVADGQATSYIDPTLLAAGKQVSREGTAYEEGSEEADIVNYMTPFKMKNTLGIFRQSHDITGSAMSDVMVMEMTDPKTGKSSKLWADYQEWVALRQWYQTIDRWLMYSKYNVNPDGTTTLTGSTGRPVYQGAGLLQQISPSNKSTYTTLTTDLLDTFLFDLSYNILGKGERKFVALTGEMGMREFDRILKEKASGYTLVDSKFVGGNGQELTLGGQFVTYRMLNGIELTLKHFPLYDNTTFNRKLHPVSGKPLESYRMTFLDFSRRDGEANIQKVVKRDREMVMWYTGGAISPSGHAKNMNTLRSNAKDSMSVHFLSECGVVMKHPEASGELICDAE